MKTHHHCSGWIVIVGRSPAIVDRMTATVDWSFRTAATTTIVDWNPEIVPIATVDSSLAVVVSLAIGLRIVQKIVIAETSRAIELRTRQQIRLTKPSVVMPTDR